MALLQELFKRGVSVDWINSWRSYPWCIVLIWNQRIISWFWIILNHFDFDCWLSNIGIRPFSLLNGVFAHIGYWIININSDVWLLHRRFFMWCAIVISLSFFSCLRLFVSCFHCFIKTSYSIQFQIKLRSRDIICRRVKGILFTIFFHVA